MEWAELGRTGLAIGRTEPLIDAGAGRSERGAAEAERKKRVESAEPYRSRRKMRKANRTFRRIFLFQGIWQEAVLACPLLIRPVKRYEHSTDSFSASISAKCSMSSVRTVEITGTPRSTPRRPNREPPAITATNTQMLGRPTDWPTTFG